MKEIVKKILNGIAAGIVISIGCAVYLACENKYVGAVMFSVALLTICLRGYSLYTGKIGFIPEAHGKEEFSVLLLGLLGNTIGVSAGGFALSFAIPKLKEAAITLCQTKLDTQTFPQTLIRGLFCGILMYIAVSVYRSNKNIVGILFAIPVFILSGFEHSIADIGYFACANIASLKAFGFIWTVILGNSIGSMLLPVVTLAFLKKKGDAQ
ncbi:MAG: formate/nitrite transporter family protein [Clostridia bacterium]|nr:formate/nitrite transporter family protein [Clostridia bacterium]MBP5781182.1 formate/nitrite transporter family protein [Clostridia bacterium]